MMLDDIDLQIMRLLQEDGRISHAALGKAVGLTGSSVYARVQRLEREGVIRGYTTLLDPEALGQGMMAFIRVGAGAAIELDDPFERFVLDEPQILECHDVDGEDSFVLKVRTASPQTLRTLVARIRSLPGVNRTVTTIALGTVKEVGASGRLPDPPPEDA